jgi:hypothetical protein
MSVLQAFAITFGTGLTLAMLWISASAIRLRFAESPTEHGDTHQGHPDL